MHVDPRIKMLHGGLVVVAACGPDLARFIALRLQSCTEEKNGYTTTFHREKRYVD